MLAIKAVRSFIEQPAAGTASVALSTSRNSVTANVVAKFGETIILSGLNERELVRGASGVPVLRDIPGIQYMFANDTSSDFFRTVMVMVTPRKPVRNDQDMANARLEKIKAQTLGRSISKKYEFYWRVDDYDKFLSKSAPNLDTVIDTLETNNLYKAFKSKDLIDTNWAAESKFAQFMHDFETMFWH